MEVTGMPSLPPMEVISQQKLPSQVNGLEIKFKSNEYLKN
jgi:hypothetical protein